MSHKEKENIVSLISAVIVTIPYLIFTVFRVQDNDYSTAEELKFWASAVLLIIPVRIVAQILVYIASMILKGMLTGKIDEKEITDERDQIIELRGERVTTSVFIFGFMAAMVSILLDGSVSVMFITILLAGFIGEVLGSIAKIFYYQKGV